MLRMRKEVQKSSASRPLARSGHRHCCRPSRWCQSWFLLVVSFRSRRPCPWSSVSFLEISRTRRLCASGKVGKRSQQAKRYVQLFGFRNGGFVFSAFKIDHQANRLLGKIPKGGKSMRYRRRAGDKKYTNNLMPQTYHALLFQSFLQTHVATALSGRSFIRTSAGTITPMFSSIIRH